MDDNSPQDIQQVADDEILFRRVISAWIKKKEDGTTGLSSASYYQRSGEISVDIASKTTPEKSIMGAIALAGFVAKVPKDLGNPVVEKPIEEDLEHGIEANPAHALITGKINKTRAKKLAGASSWVIQPT